MGLIHSEGSLRAGDTDCFHILAIAYTGIHRAAIRPLQREG